MNFIIKLLIMEEGFVLSNKFRKVVFNELVVSDANARDISKKHHIPLSAVERAIKDLEGAGLIKEDKERYTLTKEGEKLAEKLKRQMI